MLARITTLSLFLGLAGLASTARADHPPAAPDPKPLQPLKRLVGTWQGNATMHDKGGDKTIPVTITYDATAGGTAIVEHLFPGTPHEMLSVYTVEGDGLAMTHYCALGNHPKMALKKADAHSLSFEASGSEGLRSPSEMHMHAMTVAWTDGDHIRETWTSFDQGKPKDEKVFDLTRKK
ncbi:MAG TPA: hypothetical protein VHM31_11775 [Polyangia bacterium]|nr:hypothetical protein [Polyangia bacterium]